jgi:hypothetical protein
VRRVKKLWCGRGLLRWKRRTRNTRAWVATDIEGMGVETVEGTTGRGSIGQTEIGEGDPSWEVKDWVPVDVVSTDGGCQDEGKLSTGTV